MSNMDKIIDYLQRETQSNKERWIDTKTGWNKYKHCEKKERLVEQINAVMNPKAAARTRFTIVKDKDDNIRVWRTEEALERFITAANAPLLKNQYSVGKGGDKEAVDIVMLDGKKIIKLIEIKPWESNDSPIYGFIELLKNYVLYKNKNEVKELLLLAPRKYYASYYKESSIDNFFKTMKKFSSKNEWPEFKLAYLNLDKEDFDKAIQSLGSINKWENVEYTKAFCYKKTVDITDESLKIIRDKLIIGNWVDIKSFKDWPR